MSQPVVITCAITGSHQDFARHPDYPITPEQIARDCVDAAKAGAAVAHIHVRDPATGWPSMDVALYREVIDRVHQSGSDIILNLTAGEGGVFEPSEANPGISTDRCTVHPADVRVAHITELRPEICTIDVATMNFGEFVFMNSPGQLRAMAQQMIAAGTQPEIEVFDLGHIVLAQKLRAEGILTGKLLFQLCLGISYGAPANARVVELMSSMLPSDATWSAFAVGPLEFDMVAHATAMGGNVRVGLEDNLYLKRGTWATNATLVDRAATIIGAMNRDVATPDQAREIMGVNARRGRTARPGEMAAAA